MNTIVVDRCRLCYRLDRLTSQGTCGKCGEPNTHVPEWVRRAKARQLPAWVRAA